MKTDSTLKTPLRGGLSIERVITAAGGIKITVYDSEFEELFFEEFTAPGGADAAQEAEPVL